jgi:hypothetical protein
MFDIYIAKLVDLFESYDFITLKNMIDKIYVSNEMEGPYLELKWKSLKKIKKENIPDCATDISFASRYNKPIEKNTFPSSVISIVFNDFFEQPLEEGSLPPNLKYLYFGRKYNIENAVLPKSITDLIYYDLRKSSVIYRIHKLSINKIITLTTYYPNFHFIETHSYNDYSNYDELQYDYEDEIYEEYEYYEQNAKISIKIDDVTIVRLPVIFFPNVDLLDLFIDRLSIYINQEVENHIKIVSHPEVHKKLLEVDETNYWKHVKKCIMKEIKSLKF